MIEEWRRLPSPYRAYEVSNFGEIRRGGRILKCATDRYGYLNVNLYYAGIGKKFKVHRVVCAAFHGPAPEGADACHGDGIRSNNAAANLRWGTRSDNVQDSLAHGTHRPNTPPKEAMPRGSAHSSAKLSEAIVMEARRLHSSGVSGRQLARQYGVTSANMSAALRGDTWAHVAESDAP